MSDFYSTIISPITGNDPFGMDVNYDLDYERLKGEMGKLGDIDADVVESLSLTILTEKSKDVRALAFLAYSVLRKNELGRLADVFCALATFCQDNFEQIYPRRESAKASALRWFSESRFSGQCEKVMPTAADVQDIVRFADAVLKLRAALDKRFSDSTPPLSLLHKKALEWKKLAENAANEAVSAAESPANANGVKNAGNGSVNNQQRKEIYTDEYQEILQCIKKIETFIINLKQGTAV